MLFPSEQDEFQTEGEGQVYRWLSHVAVPSSDFLIWYTPDVSERQPDFLLFHDSVGLLVLEVKDWAMERILEADAQYVKLKIGSKVERRENPLRQARGYFGAIHDAVKADRRLLSSDPAHREDLKFPVGFGAVLPNIHREEFLEHSLDRVMPAERIFFFDDLSPLSPLMSDPSGTSFRDELSRRFPPKFPFSLNGKEKYFLKGVLFPEVRVQTVERPGGTPKYAEEMSRLQVLDHNQEAIARRWSGGHQLIEGPSGSGKTLILTHKAAFLLRDNPSIKRVLFVCYNLTLVGYIKRLLANLGVPLGPDGVEVMHFYELCSAVTDLPVNYEERDRGYYKETEDLALDAITESSLIYDAILVDEGQDFSEDMIRLVIALLSPLTNSLTVAVDEAQDLYQRGTGAWREHGLFARREVMSLTEMYRNTEEVANFARRLRINDTKLDHKSDLCEQVPVLKGIYENHGAPPTLEHFSSFADAVSSIPRQIHKLRDDYGYPLSEFAVLYVTQKPRALDCVDVAKIILAELEGHGLLCKWASQDSGAKRAYDISTNSVTVSTVHSAKGLDFACVFLVGFDLLEPGPHWSEETLTNLAYVAATRARCHLIIPYVNNGVLIERMKAALADGTRRR